MEFIAYIVALFLVWYGLTRLADHIQNKQVERREEWSRELKRRERDTALAAHGIDVEKLDKSLEEDKELLKKDKEDGT